MNYYYLLNEQSQKKILSLLETMVNYPSVLQIMRQDKELYKGYTDEEYLCLKEWMREENEPSKMYQAIRRYHQDPTLDKDAVRKFLSNCMTMPYFREALVDAYTTSKIPLASYAQFALTQGLNIDKRHPVSYNRAVPDLNNLEETAENMVIGDLVHEYYHKDEVLDVDREVFIEEVARYKEIARDEYSQQVDEYLSTIKSKHGKIPDAVLKVDIVYPHLTNITNKDVNKKIGAKAPLEKHL